MSGIVVNAVGADLTADGGTNGSAQVASSAGFFVNARVWISATGVTSRECLIAAISGGTLSLRFVDGPPNYGVSDLSAFTVAAGARVDQDEQFVAGAALPTLADVMRTDGQSVTSAVPITAPSLVLGNASGPMILTGSGDPEGAVTAPVGSTFHRQDGGAGTSLYVKESGAGNTGWVGK